MDCMFSVPVRLCVSVCMRERDTGVFHWRVPWLNWDIAHTAMLGKHSYTQTQTHMLQIHADPHSYTCKLACKLAHNIKNADTGTMSSVDVFYVKMLYSLPAYGKCVNPGYFNIL